jgi:hypothetical protein
MGLSSADYQRGGIVGFGEYNSGQINNLGFAAKTTNAERVNPLPFLYTGPVRG